MFMQANSGFNNRLHKNYRQYFTRNIQHEVMYGVLDVYCMKYGVWAINHLRV